MAERDGQMTGDNPISRRQLLRGAVAGGAALSLGGLLAACASGDPGQTPVAVSTSGSPAGPSRGGRLRVGVKGIGPRETLDAHMGTAQPDFVRQYSLYERLVNFAPDGSKFDLTLAEEIEHDGNAELWTIRVKDGIEFHHGKTLSADDVIFTLQRLTDPAYKGKPFFKEQMVASSLKRVDDRTVQFRVQSPNMMTFDALSGYVSMVVPTDYDPQNPVGTGPFKFQSFTPGSESMFSRFDNYWQNNRPYLDELQVISLDDADASMNALLSNQVDVVEDFPFARRSQLEANPEIEVLESTAPIRWTPFITVVDAAPFSDVRVRQALRLLVDREQMVEQVLGGHGMVANDMIWCFDEYPDVPQRTQDIDQAKALLKEAGHENLAVELVTTHLTGTSVAAAEVFAEQAKAGGVDINIRVIDSAEFWGDGWGQRPLTMDYWSAQSYFAQCESMYFPPPGVHYNETHWADEEWNSVITQAIGTPDDAARQSLVQDAMRIEYERGGYINWGVGFVYDAYNSKVGGLYADARQPIGSADFRQAHIIS